MTGKRTANRELRKLSRADLLELLLAANKENEALRSELEDARKKLDAREIEIGQSGSLAEAALRLNGIFLAADRAAQQYLENIRRLSEKQTDEKES